MEQESVSVKILHRFITKLYNYYFVVSAFSNSHTVQIVTFEGRHMKWFFVGNFSQDLFSQLIRIGKNVTTIICCYQNLVCRMKWYSSLFQKDHTYIWQPSAERAVIIELMFLKIHSCEIISYAFNSYGPYCGHILRRFCHWSICLTC